ncbi:Rpn family recombination-promoting nuclease/putative transposase [Virgibacillus sp. FSP13]
MDNNQYHNIFHLREDTTHILLTNDIEIHFMELRKLEEDHYDLSDRLTKWLLFLKGIQQDEWEEIAMETPELKKAMTTLEFLSQDKETRRLYEMRQKALLDERSALGKARREGKEEGKAEEKKEVAIKLLADGMSITKVAELTGLSEVEIESLKSQ